MTTLALCSLKASPGVTTTAQALAEVWPAGRGLLVAELDPAGGDLAARLDRSPEPGLVTLAAAGRRGVNPELLLEHTQEISSFTRLLLAPPSARQARAALDLVGDDLVDAISAVDGWDVAMDCGRLDTDSSGLPWLLAADHVLVMLRPTAAEVAHAAPAVADLRSEYEHVELVVLGEPGPGHHHLYPADEVAAAVGAAVAAVIADDDRAAAVLDGRRRGERMLRRSPLLRTATALAATLTHTDGSEAPAIDVARDTSPSAETLLIEGAS